MSPAFLFCRITYITETYQLKPIYKDFWICKPFFRPQDGINISGYHSYHKPNITRYYVNRDPSDSIYTLVSLHVLSGVTMSFSRLKYCSFLRSVFFGPKCTMLTNLTAKHRRCYFVYFRITNYITI
ncbi:hypothetical protein CLIB1444_20S00386 [[Candida] jaroonii]|uniref:Uncharacterized protein n=1 Tax=[Candida] jaroonii TaxID=467808 RepID=A0ACA9YFA7_9ASCO|nr:hypothetical protein CLIB1444_20S00386 [[Candida] jaroonii]